MRLTLRARLFIVKWLPFIVMVFALSIVIVGVNLVVGNQIRASIEAGQRHSAATLFRAQVKGCDRQNIRTIAANRNARATYAEDKLFADAVTHPQPHATKREIDLTKRFHARLEDILRTLTWTPVNQDCKHVPSKVELPVAFPTHSPSRADLGLSRAKHHQ